MILVIIGVFLILGVCTYILWPVKVDEDMVRNIVHAHDEAKRQAEEKTRWKALDEAAKAKREKHREEPQKQPDDVCPECSRMVTLPDDDYICAACRGKLS